MSSDASWLYQFSLLSQRNFLNIVRLPQTSWVKLIVTCLTAAFCVVLFYDVQGDIAGVQNRNGALFFVVMMMGSLGGKRAGLWSPPTRQKSSKRSSPTLDRIGTQLLSADFLDSYFSLLTEVESLLAFTPSFKRPSPKIPRSKDARPSRFIVPPD